MTTSFARLPYRRRPNHRGGWRKSFPLHYGLLALPLGSCFNRMTVLASVCLSLVLVAILESTRMDKALRLSSLEVRQAEVTYELLLGLTGYVFFLGVGITPLLGQLPRLDISPNRPKLIWTSRLADVNIVLDVFRRHTGLPSCTDIFFTGSETSAAMLEILSRLKESGARVTRRRLTSGDLEGIDAETWYLCAGKSFKQEVLSWLPGENNPVGRI